MSFSYCPEVVGTHSHVHVVYDKHTDSIIIQCKWVESYMNAVTTNPVYLYLDREEWGGIIYTFFNFDGEPYDTHEDTTPELIVNARLAQMLLDALVFMYFERMEYANLTLKQEVSKYSVGSNMEFKLITSVQTWNTALNSIRMGTSYKESSSLYELKTSHNLVK